MRLEFDAVTDVRRARVARRRQRESFAMTGGFAWDI
jgi:hypothetical protein